MINRTLGKKILELSKLYPVLSVTGPRQSGKTTLVKNFFKEAEYYNLENPDILRLVQSDPRGFLNSIEKEQVIIDEIQRFPDLLSYIQVEVDEYQPKGKFIITGSQNFNISEKITQSLAGRVANLVLLPFSISELANSEEQLTEFKKTAINGFYPRIYDQQIPAKEFYRDYLYTYVERDVRQIKNIGDLNTFQRFLHLVAGRVGQIVNLSSLANDVGVSYKTIESWLSVLAASYVIFQLPPYFKNFGKRVIKSPKLYFYDTGLLCYLLGIDDEKELTKHYSLGSIFENMIIADILKKIEHTRSTDAIYFWRDNQGKEIDLVIDHGGQQTIIEIKAGMTFNNEMLEGLNYWLNISESETKASYLIYTGDHQQTINKHKIINWTNFLLKKI